MRFILPTSALAAACSAARERFGPPPPAPATAPEGNRAAARPEPEARAFDLWLGSWRVESFQKPPGGPVEAPLSPTGEPRSIVEAGAGGCVIFARWRGVAARGEVAGVSARAREPAAGHWLMVGHWPAGPTGAPFTLPGALESGAADFHRELARREPDGWRPIERATLAGSTAP